jgi:hypothetical protein
MLVCPQGLLLLMLRRSWLRQWFEATRPYQVREYVVVSHACAILLALVSEITPVGPACCRA